MANLQEQTGAMLEKSVGTTERVADVIRSGIQNGHFVPGQHLVEMDLTRRLQISRSSLREALRHLTGDGIVDMHRYRGTHICRLSRQNAGDLLDVLEQLVRLGARRAAVSRACKKALMDAANLASPTSTGLLKTGTDLKLRQAFYDALFLLSGNQELARVAPLWRADLLRAQIRPFLSADQQLHHAQAYGAIAQAVMKGDAVAAEQAVHEHFEATQRMLGTLPEQAFDAD